MIKKIISRIMCFFGFHDWETLHEEDIHDNTSLEESQRRCRHCDLKQHLSYGGCLTIGGSPNWENCDKGCEIHHRNDRELGAMLREDMENE